MKSAAEIYAERIEDVILGALNAETPYKYEFRRKLALRIVEAFQPHAELHTAIAEARTDERRKAATVARCRVPPEMADYIEHQVMTGGTG